MWDRAMLWLLFRLAVEWQEVGRGRFTFLCVCPGLPVRLVLTVSCEVPLLCVCTYACACESAGKKDSFISCFSLDHSYLKDMCDGKQKAATTHMHTYIHTHPTLPPALSLIYKPIHISAHTHTHTQNTNTWNVRADHREVRQDSQKGALFIWGTQIWQIHLK